MVLKQPVRPGQETGRVDLTLALAVDGSSIKDSGRVLLDQLAISGWNKIDVITGLPDEVKVKAMKGFMEKEAFSRFYAENLESDRWFDALGFIPFWSKGMFLNPKTSVASGEDLSFMKGELNSTGDSDEYCMKALAGVYLGLRAKLFPNLNTPKSVDELLR